MQAVILVGGKGERLKPFTDNIPKPMVEVAGLPFLAHLINLLKANGLSNFLFLTGYRGDIIKDHFGTGSKWKIEIDYSFEDRPLGTGGALKFAKEKLDKEFFLLFGDSYLPINYKQMISDFKKDNKKVMLAIYDNADNTDVPFNIMLDKSRKLVSAYRKAKNNPPDFNYCDAGVLIVNKGVVDLVGDSTPVSFEEKIYPHLIGKKELGYYISECRFYDIGTVERLKVFERYFLNEKARVLPNDHMSKSFPNDPYCLL